MVLFLTQRKRLVVMFFPQGVVFNVFEVCVLVVLKPQLPLSISSSICMLFSRWWSSTFPVVLFWSFIAITSYTIFTGMYVCCLYVYTWLLLLFFVLLSKVFYKLFKVFKLSVRVTPLIMVRLISIPSFWVSDLLTLKCCHTFTMYGKLQHCTHMILV